MHTAYHVAAYEWQGCWQRDGPCRRSLKQHLMESMFFDLLLMARNRKAVAQRDKNSPIIVVVKCDDDDELRKYCPRSDFSISIFTLPRLLVEVNSTSQDSWPMDLIRMLTTGAFIVRFANKFVSRFKEKKNFVLCAVFIYDDGTTIRHTLFQNQNDETVYYNELQFSLNGAHERVKFVRSLYNLLFVELDQDPDETAKGAISELHDRIKDRHLKSFHTKNLTGHSRKRRRTDNNNDDGAGGGGGDDHGQLRGGGYEVKPEVIVDASGGEWQPLSQVLVTLFNLCAMLTLDLRDQLIFSPCIVPRTRTRNSSRKKFGRNRTSSRSSEFSIPSHPSLTMSSRWSIRSTGGLFYPK
ncbi:hypothetical protein L210DRAFT_3086351 [Boletus edulis BED1]|uniref:Uncharacterized protein n=1 Tax=Boletus edulis BED1 TaxID=1328754 RepID=A0AAD4BGU2_BOLED|nr:hypothetical protein L210DRAFT_3086351 [Boletus edulis BED1]